MNSYYERNIALIEDNMLDIKIIKDELEQSKDNYNVILFNDGNAAYQYFDNLILEIDKNPHLIILDLSIPNINGIDLLKKLKANDKTKQIPVVVLSLSQYKDEIASTYQNYANCFISKPKDLSEFVKRIKIISNFWFNVAKLPQPTDVY